MLEASEAFTAGLAGVWPLTRVASQVSLQIRLPLHRVRAEGAFKAHRGGGVWGQEGDMLYMSIFHTLQKKL